MKRLFAALSLFVAQLGPEGGIARADEPPAAIDYLRDIRPLLKERCFTCHGPLKQEGNLRLDSGERIRRGGDSGAAAVPGKTADSQLLQRILAKDPAERMPPEAEPLKPEQIDRLTRWIAEGAVTPADDQEERDPRRHWSFQPVVRPAVPHPFAAAGNAATPAEGDDQNPIDAFIDARLSAGQLTRQPPADRRQLVRRLFLDVTGLPPDPEVVEAFVADERPDAYRKLVESVLASQHYGERAAQLWLDVVRYADTHGFEVNTQRDNAWPYRDYVVRSFNDDKPYDRFLSEQLAGDALGADEATGFLVAAAVLLPGQIGQDDASKRLARQDALDEMIGGTSSAMLGITLACARCHDHKFDPLKQRDYYALQGFFAGVEYGDRPILDAEAKEHAAAAAALAPRIDQLEQRLRAFEPEAFTGRTLLIDEEDSRLVTVLKPKNGPGGNPAGTNRGYRDDPGAADRVGNLSGGRYTWWNNVSGEDVLTYTPGASGRYRLWLSWGAHGSGVHTRDARYVLDRDGDLATRNDQQEIARVDQYYPAGVTSGTTEQTPLWSGLLDAGTWDWTPTTRLILRGGETGTGITADVIVLQEDSGSGPAGRALPQFRPPVDPKTNVERFPAVSARFVRFRVDETIDSNRHEPCLDELEIYGPGEPQKNLALASLGTKPTSSGNYSETGSHQLKHINDGAYGNGRSWISNQLGGGWVQLELPRSVEIDRVVWGRDRDGKYADRLATRYHIEVSSDGAEWKEVAGHGDRLPRGTPFDAVNLLLAAQAPDRLGDLPALIAERNSLRAEKQRLETPRLAFAGTFRAPDTTYLLRRGDPEQREGEVAPAVPELFRSAGETAVPLPPEQDRRLQLARWIASPENPLTARVLVNRVWQSHFGRGIVETANDFGLNGTAPSHPELLDWLASEFVASGWSIKHLHRLILTSSTYRQGHAVNAAAEALDRDNRLLWRFPSRRVEAESIRDGMLAVSGELNLAMGGPGFDFFRQRGGLSGFVPVENFPASGLRRMIYAHKIRMESTPVFGPFDCPDAGQSTPRRDRSTTAVQALNLFNSPFVAQRAERFAARVEREVGAGAESQVVRAFALALGRPPAASEREASVKAVESAGLATLCRVLLNSNEFLFLP